MVMNIRPQTLREHLGWDFNCTLV